jgi:hypothetical protein
VTAGPQATFVVEYPCDQFCRIEVELTGERNNLTLQQMWEKADGQHRRVHEPENSEVEAAVSVAEQEAQRPASLFRSAPGPARDDDRRREDRARPRR